MKNIAKTTVNIFSFDHYDNLYYIKYILQNTLFLFFFVTIYSYPLLSCESFLIISFSGDNKHKEFKRYSVTKFVFRKESFEKSHSASQLVIVIVK